MDFENTRKQIRWSGSEDRSRGEDAVLILRFQRARQML